MSLPLRTLARMLGALAAGAVGSGALVGGFPGWVAWALLGAALVGALTALERITTGYSLRSARAFLAGALVGAPAGLIAYAASTALAPAFSSWVGQGLAPVMAGVVAYGGLGVAAGAAPGFFAFSGALSRGGATGGALGGAGGAAFAVLVPPLWAPVVGATCIGAAYVAWRRTHAAARLVPLGREGGIIHRDITLRGHWVTVGTGSECDLRLDESEIERLRPMVVVLRDGSYWVEDPLGRVGALKVNGQPKTHHRLSHGDVIEVGRSRYRFEVLDPARV